MCISCNAGCGWEKEFWTSPKKSKSRNYEVNGRMFYAMRRLGKGYRGTKRLLNLLNHPPPTTKNNYKKISDNFHKAAKNVADHTMHLATKELRQLKPTLCNDDVTVNDITDCWTFV